MERLVERRLYGVASVFKRVFYKVALGQVVYGMLLRNNVP